MIATVVLFSSGFSLSTALVPASSFRVCVAVCCIYWYFKLLTTNFKKQHLKHLCVFDLVKVVNDLWLVHGK